jgi:hypothetical protein
MLDQLEMAQQHLQEVNARITRQAAVVEQFERYGQVVLAEIGRTILMDLRDSRRTASDRVELLKKPPPCCTRGWHMAPRRIAPSAND